MSGKPPIPAEMSPAGDERFAKFLSQAAPIVAAERGLTAIARAKLELLAKDLNFSAEETNQAFQQLQNGTADPAPPPRIVEWQQQQFEKYLHKKLKKLPVPVLSPDQEDRLLAIALKRHGLPNELAREAVAVVTSEMKITRRERSDVVDSLARLILTCLEKHDRITEEDWKQIHESGHQWGLRPEQIRQVVDDTGAAWRLNLLKRRRWRNIAVVTLTATAFLGFVALAVMMSSQTRKKFLEPNVVDRSAVNGMHQVASVARPIAPKWWDVDLAVAVADRKKSSLEFVELYDSLLTEDPETRAAAYERCAQLAVTSSASSVPAVAWRGVIAGFVALDPDSVPRERLRKKMLAAIDVARRTTTPQEGDLHRAYWSLDCMLAAVEWSGIPTSHAEELIAALESSLGFAWDRRASSDSRRNGASAALTSLFYRQAISSLAKSTNRSRQLDSALATYAERYLSDAERLRWETEMITELLSKSTSGWESYRDLLDRSIALCEPLQLLKLIEVFEQTANEMLQSHLQEQLLKRTKLLASATREETARAMRSSLGVKAPVDTAASRAARWKKLQTASQPLVSSDGSATGVIGGLNRTLRCARAATYALALLQPDTTSEQLDPLGSDEMLTAGLPAVPARNDSASGGFTPEPSRGVPDKIAETRQKTLTQQLAVLRNYERYTTAQRQSAFRQVAALVLEIDEPKPFQADGIARYLAAVKTPAEFQAIAESIPMVGRWKSVRLTLADRLSQTELKIADQAILVSLVLGRDISVDAVTSGMIHLRRELMQSVLAQLPMQPIAEDDHKLAVSLDHLEPLLRETYIERLRLIGGDANFGEAASCGDVLLRFCQTLIARLEKQKLASEDQAWLQQWPSHLQLLDYLGTTDLQRTVILQRHSLKLLAMLFAAERPERVAAVREFDKKWLELDAGQRELIAQLRIAEIAHLRLLLLLAPSLPEKNR